MTRSLTLLPALALACSLAQANCDYDDFPRMDGMLLGMIADGMVWNGAAINARSFRVPANVQAVKDFYGKKWEGAVDFTTFGPWEQILHLNEKCMLLVQVQAQGAESRYSFGKVMLSNPSMSGASQPIVGDGVPAPGDAQVVSDLHNDDPLRSGRQTLLLVADDIHRTRAWYESEMLTQGWQLEHRSTLAGSVVLNYAKGRELMTIGMLRHENNTQVLITRMGH